MSISEKTIKLGYYPSYKQCTPGQRYSYLCWLCTDLSVVPDIGFAFILLDCLERHIVNNENVKRCVQLIIKMQKSVNNKSFTYYSTTSIAYAVIVLKRSDLLSEINLENCNPYFQVLLSNKLSPQDLVNFAKLVGFTNNRYIKNYKDYFIKALSEVLKKDYGTPYFTYKFTNLDKIARIPVLFSNIALNEPALLDGQVYSIPNLFSNIDFSAEIYKELQKAHSEVKNFLKIKRASDPNFSEAEKRKNQIKTKKRINPDTGYPMSTDKQIQYAKEEIDNVKSILIYHQTELKDPIYQKYNPLSTKLDKVIDKVQYESRIPFVEGMYFYKCGEWEKAENKWLSCLFTSFEPADRLRIMYQKEKRFKDAVSIIQLVLHSSFTRAIAPQSIEETEGKLEKAKQRARKNEKIDKSKLTSSKLNQLDNEATKLAKKYLN